MSVLWRFGFFIGTALILSLVGCGGQVSDPEVVLEERVMARWQAFIERDFEAAWEYYSPGFRQTTQRDDFVREMSGRPVHWRSAEFQSKDCSAERCEVQVSAVWQAVTAPAGMNRMRLPREFNERWILVDGNWWYADN